MAATGNDANGSEIHDRHHHRFLRSARITGRRDESTRWEPESLVCGFKGHITPAAHVAELRPEDAGVGVQISPERRFVRCLRCDGWLDVASPERPTSDHLPPVSELEVPLRDGPLRDLLVLRLIALDRVLHVVFFALVAAVVLFIYTNLEFVRHEAARLLPSVRQAIEATGADPSHNFLTRELHHISQTNGSGLFLIGATAVAYVVVEGAEAVGLWLNKRWAEYLTAVATAGFLPFEVIELIDQVTVVRVAALVINLAILVYLVVAKRLFGVRGGAAALQHDRATAEELYGAPGKDARPAAASA